MLEILCHQTWHKIDVKYLFIYPSIIHPIYPLILSSKHLDVQMVCLTLLEALKDTKMYSSFPKSVLDVYN